jgi:hypothetical protein
MKTVIFDLDGTLALIDDRRQLATRPNGKLDWDLFFAPENIRLDQPNIPVIAVYNLLQNEGYHMVILSGRDAISKTATMSWLRNHGIDFDELRMRPQGTFTPDDVLKKGWLDELGAENIFCVFDDRDKVVKMWRDNGLTCFQVNYGNF